MGNQKGMEMVTACTVRRALPPVRLRRDARRPTQGPALGAEAGAMATSQVRASRWRGRPRQQAARARIHVRSAAVVAVAAAVAAGAGRRRAAVEAVLASGDLWDGGGGQGCIREHCRMSGLAGQRPSQYPQHPLRQPAPGHQSCRPDRAHCGSRSGPPCRSRACRRGRPARRPPCGGTL